jgi:hypothetical protein
VSATDALVDLAEMSDLESGMLYHLNANDNHLIRTVLYCTLVSLSVSLSIKTGFCPGAYVVLRHLGDTED